jgi:hypothetical protein
VSSNFLNTVTPLCHPHGLGYFLGSAPGGGDGWKCGSVLPIYFLPLMVKGVWSPSEDELSILVAVTPISVLLSPDFNGLYPAGGRPGMLLALKSLIAGSLPMLGRILISLYACLMILS